MATRPPLDARHIAEVKHRAPRRQIQVIKPHDLRVSGILEALDREFQRCTNGMKECGPCYMLREHEVDTLEDAFRYELFAAMK